MDRIKKVIKRQLTHLQSTERDEAITMLLLVGIKHYSLLYPDHSLQMPYLKFLADKYVGEFVADAKESQQDRSSLKRLERNQLLLAERARKYRADSMAHYPFADEYGSMQDVLSGPLQDEPVDLEDMGLPGRNRLMIKVFNEMRFDRNGIRLSDLPEALERVGIAISSTLRRTLERARSKQVDGPLVGGRDEEPLLEYMEKHIPLGLWKTIVKNFLLLRRRGINPSDLREVLPELAEINRRRGLFNQQQGSDNNDYEEDGDDDAEQEEFWTDDVRGQEEIKRTQSAPSRLPQQSQQYRRTEEYYGEDSSDFGQQLAQQERQPSPKFQSTTTSNRNSNTGTRNNQSITINKYGRKAHGGGKGNTGPPTHERRSREYFNRLRNVPSRLGSIIQQDRGKFFHNRQQTDNAALSSLARRRVATLLNSNPALGFRDPNYSQEPSASRKAGTSQRRRYQDLESGTAALEIADAFLRGSVGKELVSTSEGDGTDYLLDEEEIQDLSPLQAQRRAAAMLGISSRDNTVHRRQASSSSSAPPSFGMGFRSLKEKTTERELDEESKRLYKASGWKSAKGGWAADFGPSHTQKLYTGPDRYHAFMHERKSSPSRAISGDEHEGEEKGGRQSRSGERILEDEMLLSLAKDVYSEKSPSLRRADSSKSTIAFTVPIQKQVSLASSGRRVSALTSASDSGSSGSLDAGVVGAGLDEEFGEDFTAADELFGKLQKSMSLKAAAGTQE